MVKKNNNSTFNLRTNRNTEKKSSGIASSFFSSNTNETHVDNNISHTSDAPNYTDSIVNHLVNASSGLDSVLVNIDDLYSAPDDWNFYDRLPAGKMQELIESIISIGLQEPVIVWKKDDSGKYMILSGHNRVHAYKILCENQDSEKYSKIHAVIKDKNLSEEEAKEIIVDTNWVQRQLTTIQKARSINFKYRKLKKDSLDKKLKFDINSVIADEYQITSRQLISYKSLGNLTETAQNAVDNAKLSIKAGVAISKLMPEDQDYIINNFDISILNKNYSKIKSACDSESGVVDKSKLSSLLTEEELGSITIKVPIEYKDSLIAEIEALKKKYNIKKIN
ncbi:ParB/RepB/Spo0J family partition protein [Clostridium butyricum]|uniref:ParB/RepB/Spo0J family partition protein n=1 Tax=Clostridium butyricum TaxID=1492 RepID=UPI0004075EBD|nr:ParB/RepB/Spo0J family partition protein [Clostridium butyricum]MBZ0314183.1 ParB/RepB/Spo0J family partition protein [Clostridium butyricum]